MRTLVISDGGLAALCATGIAANEFASDTAADDGPIVWAPHLGDEHPSVHRDAAVKHASLLAVELIETQADTPRDDAPAGLIESELLIQAGHLAARHGCGRVVWAVQFPTAHDEEPDLDRISRAVDRAVLASRLVSLDARHYGMTEVTIETPFADLSDEQVADLAVDLRVPIETCWWWSALGAHGSGAGAEQERWTAALRSVGWAGLPAGV